MNTFTDRFRNILTAFAACAAITLMVTAQPAFATHFTDTFEIDGDAVNNGAVTGDDWSNLYSGGGSATLFTGIIPDPISTQKTFTKGSKDTKDISTWRFSIQSSPPKDDITNAYAVAYATPDLHIYFGADRASNNGDTTIGFWFFKGNISVNTTTGQFIGTHQDGDLLVVSDFTTGGTTHTITLFKWAGTGISGSLQQIASGTISNLPAGTPFCPNILGTTDAVCAVTNGTDVTAPWPYSPSPGTFPTGTFFEGGINIAELIPSDTCFSSFLAETRSSTSTNAELKNFVLSSFPVCGLAATKACTSPVLVGTNQVRYTVAGSVSNTGLGTVYNIGVVDSPALDSSSLGFFTCDGSHMPTTTPASPSSLPAGQEICYKATTTFPANQNGGTDSITASGNTASNGTGTTVSADPVTASCPPLQLTPDVTVSKECKVCLDSSSTANRVVLKASYSGSVCNNSTTFPLFNVNVTDAALTGASDTLVAVSPSGTNLSSFTLGAASCQTFKGSYFPTAARLFSDILNSTTLKPYDAAFRDVITVTGNVPFGTNQTLGSTPAECTLCNPATVCP